MNAPTSETVLAALADRPLHDAQKLTGEDGCALITLGDQIYTLRITRAGKLILTK
ncbi:MAG: hemin uptake protein HemP [Pseudomonadota bacterium]